MTKNENMVTERTTDGDNPAKIANDHKENKVISNLVVFPFLEFGIERSKKVINPMINPTCKPETDKI